MGDDARCVVDDLAVKLGVRPSHFLQIFVLKATKSLGLRLLPSQPGREGERSGGIRKDRKWDRFCVIG